MKNKTIFQFHQNDLIIMNDDQLNNCIKDLKTGLKLAKKEYQIRNY